MSFEQVQSRSNLWNFFRIALSCQKFSTLMELVTPLALLTALKDLERREVIGANMPYDFSLPFNLNLLHSALNIQNWAIACTLQEGKQIPRMLRFRKWTKKTEKRAINGWNEAVSQKLRLETASIVTKRVKTFYNFIKT